MGTFVLVVITVTGLSYGPRTWEGYYPQQMVGGLTYKECHSIVSRSVTFKQKFDYGKDGSWWIETHMECWPEDAD